jgi:uncharacterized protein (TIGR00661 family)
MKSKRILYGVVGVGRGHVTRSRVILDHLLSQGHHILVTASGTAPDDLNRLYADEPRLHVEAVAGYGMRFRDQQVDVGGTLLDLIDGSPRRALTNIGVFSRLASQFHPDVVISDFEAFAHWFGRFYNIPVISLDNIQVLSRCRLDSSIIDTESLAFQVAKTTVKAKLPGADHYLISSFFAPEVRKERTTVVGPILRPEILAAVRTPGDHLLVYQSVWSDSLVEALSALNEPILAYGSERVGAEGSLRFRPFSESGFIDDLRSARGVIAGGGYSLMCEALEIGVPMLAIPLKGHVEQQLHAAYLAQCGYGDQAPAVTRRAVSTFIDNLPAFERALQRYPRTGNRPVLETLDQVLAA